MRDTTPEHERLSDVSDRATVEEGAYAAEALSRQQRKAAAMQVPPREDGECACGCGNEVNPARLALGYGLTLECAERRERMR
jgi:hypothetical protein